MAFFISYTNPFFKLSFFIPVLFQENGYDILPIFKVAFGEEVVKCSLLFFHGIKFIRLTMMQK